MSSLKSISRNECKNLKLTTTVPTYCSMKTATVERVICRMKERLFKYVSLNSTYKWVDILTEIIQNYNGRKHQCDRNT